MGSDLYVVRVASKRDRTVALDVKVIHPDAMQLPADPSFALMMLREPAESGAPLSEAVGFEETLDSKWMKKFAAGFVASVKVENVEKTAKTMKGTVEITVTNPAWIAHVTKGARWDSRAFQLISKYDKCAPISPGQDDSPDTGTSDGFMVIPTAVWLQHRLPKSAPAMTTIPAYGAGAYRMAEKITSPSPKVLAGLVGRPVRVERKTRAEDGVLFAMRGYFGLFGMREGSRGMSGVSPADITSIGLLELKPKARLGERLSYKYVSRAIDHRVVAAKRSGKRLELDVQLPPDLRMPSFTSKSQIMVVLATPILRDDKLAGSSPLARALKEDSKRLAEQVSSYSDLANGYIASFTLAAPKEKQKPSDLDAMSEAEVRAYFDKPRPCAKLVIEVTDPHWLDHFDKQFEPYSVEDNWVEDPIPWPGKVRRFKA
jgi:hypothetical protein